MYIGYIKRGYRTQYDMYQIRFGVVEQYQMKTLIGSHHF